MPEIVRPEIVLPEIVLPEIVMSGGPQPHEVAAIMVALRRAARPVEAAEPPRRRRPIVLAPLSGGRAWRLASARVV